MRRRLIDTGTSSYPRGIVVDPGTRLVQWLHADPPFSSLIVYSELRESVIRNATLNKLIASDANWHYDIIFCLLLSFNWGFPLFPCILLNLCVRFILAGDLVCSCF